MNIEVPDEWAAKFSAYEAAEKVLISQYNSQEGVSRAQINKAFAAFSAVRSCWASLPFRVWAALRGCKNAQDFYKVWDPEYVDKEKYDEKEEC